MAWTRLLDRWNASLPAPPPSHAHPTPHPHARVSRPGAGPSDWMPVPPASARENCGRRAPEPVLGARYRAREAPGLEGDGVLDAAVDADQQAVQPGAGGEAGTRHDVRGGRRQQHRCALDRLSQRWLGKEE